MTVKKQKPLLEPEVPAMQLPPLSIEEPSERSMPTPVPVIIPGMTVMGGTTYVANVARELGLKVSPSILTSVPILRQAELGLGISGEEVPPILIDVSAKIKSMVEYWLSTEIVKEVNLGIGVAREATMVTCTKYDGVEDVLFYHGFKYDGVLEAFFIEGYKYDGVQETTES